MFHDGAPGTGVASVQNDTELQITKTVAHLEIVDVVWFVVSGKGKLLSQLNVAAQQYLNVVSD